MSVRAIVPGGGVQPTEDEVHRHREGDDEEEVGGLAQAPEEVEPEVGQEGTRGPEPSRMRRSACELARVGIDRGVGC